MTIFATVFHLTFLTATLAVGTLTAVDGATAEGGMVEVPAALNPDKLSIFGVVSATGVQVYACIRNPAGATGWVLRGPNAQLFDQRTSSSASIMQDRLGKISTVARW
jgi:Protein of unknown function (DUF3455)